MQWLLPNLIPVKQSDSAEFSDRLFTPLPMANLLPMNGPYLMPIHQSVPGQPYVSFRSVAVTQEKATIPS